MKSRVILAVVLLVMSLGVLVWRHKSYSLGIGGWARDSHVVHVSRNTCVYATSFIGWIRIGTMTYADALPENSDPGTWGMLSMFIAMPGPMFEEDVVDGSRFSRLHGLMMTCDLKYTAPSMTVRGIGIPHSVIAAVLLVYPIGALAVIPLVRRWAKHRRRVKGWCITCGYDLQGQTEPRCPECGTPMERKETEP